MIVDDEPDILESFKTILENENYDVIRAGNGKECLKKLERGCKGVIIMDVMMPEMSGFDTIREIVTGMGIKDARNIGIMEPYVHDYLEKPISVKELIRSVEKCNVYLDAKNKKRDYFFSFLSSDFFLSSSFFTL